MRFTSKLLLNFPLLFALIPAWGQVANIDPTSQIQWNLMTGTTAPTATCTQGGQYTNFPYGAQWGQSYLNTATGTYYICGSSGWASVGGGGGSMTWPGAAGIAVYAGSSAWGTSLTAPASAIVGISDTQTLTNKSINASEVNSGTLPHAQLPALLSGDIPSNAANTTGTAANITATSNSTLTTLSALSLPYSQLTSTPTIPTSASWPNAGSCTGSQYVNAITNGTTPTCAQVTYAQLGGTVPTWNQNTTGTAANITATSNSTLTTLSALSLPYAQLGGTVPTWNQNTTGSAASLSATLNTSAVPAFTGDMTNTAGSLTTTVKGINGTLLSGLGTGLLKNTTGTGVPSIAVAGTDYAPVSSPSLSGTATFGNDWNPATSSNTAPLAYGTLPWTGTNDIEVIDSYTNGTVDSLIENESLGNFAGAETQYLGPNASEFLSVGINGPNFFQNQGIPFVGNTPGTVWGPGMAYVFADGSSLGGLVIGATHGMICLSPPPNADTWCTVRLDSTGAHFQASIPTIAPALSLTQAIKQSSLTFTAPATLTSITGTAPTMTVNGTFSGGGSNAYANWGFHFINMTHPGNVGTFICSGSSTTQLTGCTMPNGVAESMPGAVITSFTGYTCTAAPCVLTFTNSGTNNFVTGSPVTFTGFSGGAGALNNITGGVLAAGLTSTTFEVSVPVVTTASSSGTASSAKIFSLGETTYLGTITGGANNAYVNAGVTTSGFTNGGNNVGTSVWASTASAIMTASGTGVNETNAGSVISSNVVNSTPITEDATYNTGSGTAKDSYTCKNIIGSLTANPSALATCTHTGTTGVTGEVKNYQIITANTTVLTANQTTTSATLANLNLSLPTVPISTTRKGNCKLIFESSATGDTVILGLNTSAAPTNFQIIGSTYFPSTSTVQNFLPPAAVSSATTTAFTAAMTVAAASTEYEVSVDFSLQTGATSPVTIGVYGDITLGGTLTLLNGSTCEWAP